MHVDAETKQTIVSGMGELHLEVYVERIKREYGVELKVGQPKVNYRETVRARVEFNHLHKKQSGGSGQYGRVVGWLEPLEADDDDDAAGGALRLRPVAPADARGEPAAARVAPRRDRLVLWNSAHTVCARDAVRGAPQYALYFWMHGVPTAPADNAP